MFKRLLIVSFFSFFLFSVLYGQTISNYAVTRSTGNTYNSIISSGIPISAWRNNATFIQDDNRSSFEDIGFDFWYNGVRYTKFSVSTNGYMDLSTSTADGTGNGAYGYENTQFSVNNGTFIALAPFYDDQTTQGADDPLGNSIKYQLDGTAPNRILTVEWRNMAIYLNTTPDLNYQVKLYESTGIIEFVYGTMTNGTQTFSYTCGINVSRTVRHTQQTENTATFATTAKNALVTIPASNSKLTLTPPTPTAVSGSISFSAVTSTSMTLTWTNWASNEVGYVVYYSTDNVSFTFLAQTTANTVTRNVTALSPGTTYYYKVYAVTEGKLSDPLSGSQATTAPTTITSAQSGNWSLTTTWVGGVVPLASDNVIIADGHTVTLNATTACNNLTVGQGTSGIFQMGNDATARAFTINGNLTISPGAQFITNTASNTTHTLTLKGDVSNNGIFNMASDAGSLCNTTFNKNGNQTVSGNGATTNFNLITQNLGTSKTNILDISVSNFTANTTNFLTLTNGTFKLSSQNTTTLSPFTTAKTISSSQRLWINAPNTTINIPASITATGDLTLNAGTLNIGDAADENLISGGGQITITGGTLNIAGRLDRTFATTVTKLDISGGTIVVPAIGSTSTTIAPFEMSVVGSVFNMSGGTIILRKEGGSGLQNLGVVASDGTLNVTGGILQIGDNATPAAQIISINTTVAFPSLLINHANATAILLNNLTIVNDVVITSGTLDANGFTITLGGNWTDNGAFTPGAGTVLFNGSGTQTLSNNGGETFNNLHVNKTSGTLNLSNSVAVAGTLTLNGSVNTGSDTLSLGTGLSTAGTLSYTSGTVIGKFRRWIVNPTEDYLFPIGTALFYRPATFNFTDLTDGSLTIQFVSTNPGSAGLSLPDGTFTVTNSFSEGYWDIGNANNLSSTNYTAKCSGNGFTSYTVKSSTRLLQRSNSSANWTVEGTHVAASGNTAQRSGLSSLPAQFCFGITACSPFNASTIAGDASVCINDTNVLYTVDSTANNSYAWSITSGSISSGANSDSIYVTWGSTGGVGQLQLIETNDCNDQGTPVTLAVNLHPLPTSDISGLTSVAANSTGITYSVTNTTDYTYSWAISGGGSFAGANTSNSVSVNWGSVVGTYTLTCTATRLCGGTENKTVAVTIRGPIVSATSGSWTTTTTWVGSVVPTANDFVEIVSGHTVIMNGTNANCYKLTLIGTANWTSESTTNVGAGGIDIRATGDITGTVAGVLTTTGGLILNKTLTSNNVSLVCQTTAGRTITGTGSVAKLTINANTTNNGNITVRDALTGSATLTQGSAGTLIFNNTSIGLSSLVANTSGNTVRYASASPQTIKPITYHHLELTNASTKTLGGAVSVNGNLTLTSATLDVSASNYPLTLGGNFTNNSGVFTARTGTVTFNNSTTIDGTADINFKHVIISNTLTGKASGNVSIGGDWTNNGTFNHNSGTITFNGTTNMLGSATSNSFNNVTISGILVAPSAGAITLSGNWTNNGTYTHNNSTITFNGTSTISGSSASTFYNSLITPTGRVTIPSGKTFANAGNLTLKADPSSMASLVEQGTGATTVGGTLAVENYFKSNNTWQYFSPAVTAASTNVLYKYYVWEFNEVSNAWVVKTSNQTMTPSRGYTVKYNTAVPSRTVTFNGTLNSGAISYPLSYTGGNGWHVVGNPYPSAVDFGSATGWANSNIDETVYYYDGTQYLEYNRSLGGSGSRYIPPQQGVFIHCNGTGQWGLTNDTRVHNAQAYYKKGASNDSLQEVNHAIVLELQLTGNGKTNSTYIAFVDDATPNFDTKYDAYKLFGSTTVAHINTLSVNDDSIQYNMNALPPVLENTHVPIQITANKGNYILSFYNISKLDTVTKILFEDKQLNTFTDLRKQSSYSFTTDSVDMQSRFVLHFNPVISKIEQPISSPTMDLYVTDNTLFVQSDRFRKDGMIEIFDISGRLVHTSEIADTHIQIDITKLPTSAYLIRYSDSEKLFTEKFIK